MYTYADFAFSSSGFTAVVVCFTYDLRYQLMFFMVAAVVLQHSSGHILKLVCLPRVEVVSFVVRQNNLVLRNRFLEDGRGVKTGKGGGGRQNTYSWRALQGETQTIRVELYLH